MSAEHGGGWAHHLSSGLLGGGGVELEGLERDGVGQVAAQLGADHPSVGESVRVAHGAAQRAEGHKRLSRARLRRVSSRPDLPGVC